jgi:hypothetical protein
VFASTFLEAGATYELLLLAYLVLLLGCAIRFAMKIGAFSPHRRQRPTAEERLSDSSLL